MLYYLQYCNFQYRVLKLFFICKFHSRIKTHRPTWELNFMLTIPKSWIIQVLKSHQSKTTLLLIVQIYINLGLHVSTLVKSSSGPLRYRSKTKSSSALWGSHNALQDLVLDLYFRGSDEDLTGVETCSPRFLYICAINKSVVLDRYDFNTCTTWEYFRCKCYRFTHFIAHHFSDRATAGKPNIPCL